ncbi:hypothetical protein FGB62_320g010 [Gracilaria domingensis]|nr:hypothetical protein FGB62_320g010 [Gracilaria domingensis]
MLGAPVVIAWLAVTIISITLPPMVHANNHSVADNQSLSSNLSHPINDSLNVEQHAATSMSSTVTDHSNPANVSTIPPVSWPVNQSVPAQQQQSQTVKQFVPFNSSLVGKVFTFYKSGIRFPILARIEISQLAIAHFPFYYSKGPFGPVDINCYGSLHLILNADENQLRTIHYVRQSPGCSCGGEFNPCDSETEESFPHGNSRYVFQRNIRVLFNATFLFRRRNGYECRFRAECLPFEARPELEAILHYLQGIGLALGFRVDGIVD